MRVLGSSLLVLAVVLTARPTGAQQSQKTTLRVATLAPRGSSVSKLLDETAKRIDAGSAGRVEVRLSLGGAEGDEAEMIGKLRNGRLEGVMMTEAGLRRVQPELQVFELPFLFASDAEVDGVRTALATTLDGLFTSAGLVRIAWSDLGWQHLMTTAKIATVSDLMKVTMAVPAASHVLSTWAKLLGSAVRSPSIIDVFPELQRGTVDTCFATLLGAVALQWYTRVATVFDEPVSYAIGALVLDKVAFALLSPADAQLVVAEGALLEIKLLALVRKDNGRAGKAMTKQGITFAPAPPAVLRELEKHAATTQTQLAGTIFSVSLLSDINNELAALRNPPPATTTPATATPSTTPATAPARRPSGLEE